MTAGLFPTQAESKEGYAYNMTQVNDGDSSSSFFQRLATKGPDGMEFKDYIFLGCVVMLTLEIITFVVKRFGSFFKTETIPVRGKHLDDLSTTDILYISFNKAGMVAFVYFLFYFMYHEPNAVWSLSDMTVWNTLIPLPVLFVIYDFFYTLLHWSLHIQAIYGYIHKHHHRQKAPSRAHVDGLNTHPIELYLGEYNHLFALFLYTNLLGMQCHIVCSGMFVVTASVLAGINHTRFDIKIKLFGGSVTFFDSKWHDVHHRIPQSNYGQYSMIWDKIFGTFREYNPSDRVNPKAQLNPLTGKSLNYSLKKEN